MLHAGDDYKHIQDPSGKIPEDEPVFLLRGQDDIAWKLLEEYVKLRRRDCFKGEVGLDEMSEQLLRHADKMREWPKKKMADMPVLEKTEKKVHRKDAKKE